MPKKKKKKKKIIKKRVRGSSQGFFPVEIVRVALNIK